MPGMLTDTGLRVVAVYADEAQPNMLAWITGTTRVLTYYLDPPLFAPDLADPATLGCVLALVREAWKDASAWCEADGADLTRWAVFGPSWATPRRIGVGASEGAALVAALEAAPVSA
jgi:hypothetical protein